MKSAPTEPGFPTQLQALTLMGAGCIILVGVLGVWHEGNKALRLIIASTVIILMTVLLVLRLRKLMAGVRDSTVAEPDEQPEADR